MHVRGSSLICRVFWHRPILPGNQASCFHFGPWGSERWHKGRGVSSQDLISPPTVTVSGSRKERGWPQQKEVWGKECTCNHAPAHKVPIPSACVRQLWGVRNGPAENPRCSRCQWLPVYHESRTISRSTLLTLSWWAVPISCACYEQTDCFATRSTFHSSYLRYFSRQIDENDGWLRMSRLANKTIHTRYFAIEDASHSPNWCMTGSAFAGKWENNDIQVGLVPPWPSLQIRAFRYFFLQLRAVLLNSWPWVDIKELQRPSWSSVDPEAYAFWVPPTNHSVLMVSPPSSLWEQVTTVSILSQVDCLRTWGFAVRAVQDLRVTSTSHPPLSSQPTNGEDHGRRWCNR